MTPEQAALSALTVFFETPFKDWIQVMKITLFMQELWNNGRLPVKCSKHTRPNQYSCNYSGPYMYIYTKGSFGPQYKYMTLDLV